MGDPQVCCGRLPNGGVVPVDHLGASAFLQPLAASNPDPSSITDDSWTVAEEFTQQIIRCIHPTLDSEEKRKDVIDYVQGLLRCSVGCEVFPYGSVPLKTYLPDGDIDLTALSTPNVEETLARCVLAVLQGEELNENAVYGVKDTQFIDAEVLYRFLDYFSKFDWDNYCVSLNGPVCKSSLPEIVVEMPENIGGNLMFDENFLKNCTEVFSVPSRCSETDLRAFPQKHLNIFDPLKENNNLGRSVHRGNFYRIRSAFKYGARKLGRILLLPRERVGDEIKRFFANTLERHGCKYRAYTQTSALAFDAEGSCSLSSISHAETFFEDEIRIKSINIDSDNDISESERYCNSGDGLERCLMRADSSQMVSELKDGTAISGSCLGGDANDHASSRLVNLRGPHGTFDSSPSSGSNHCSSQSGHYNHALKCYTSRACVENGRLDNGNFSPRKHGESYDDNMGYDSWVENWKNNLLPTNTTRDCDNNHDDLSCCASEFSSPDADILECSSLDFREGSSVGIVEDTETLNPLSDLSGDYDSHLRSLLYGQVCHGYALSAPVLSNPPAPHSQVPKQTPWGIVRMSMPLKQTSSLDMNSNGLVLGPPVNPAANSRAIGAAFGLKEKYESLGTGTFIPNANGCLCKEKPSQGRSRKKAPGNRSQRQTHTQNSGADHAFAEKNKIEEGCSESPRARSSGHGKAELSHQSHDTVEGIGHANGFSDSGWRLEFGSLGSLTSWGQFASGSSHLWGSRPSLAAAEVEHSKPLPLKRQERVVEQSYSLKNEDFPPLSH